MKKLLITFILILSSDLFAQSLEQIIQANGEVSGKIWWKFKRSDGEEDYYKRNKITQIKVSFYSLKWGQDTITGQITFHGQKKCRQNNYIKFVGLDHGYGDVTLFKNMIDLRNKEKAIGTMNDYGNKLNLNLSIYTEEDYIDFTDPLTFCSLTIPKEQAIMLLKN